MGERRVVVHECGNDYRKVLDVMAGLNGLLREYKVTALLEEHRTYVNDDVHYVPHGKRHVWVVEEYVDG